MSDAGRLFRSIDVVRENVWRKLDDGREACAAGAGLLAGGKRVRRNGRISLVNASVTEVLSAGESLSNTGTSFS